MERWRLKHAPEGACGHEACLRRLQMCAKRTSGWGSVPGKPAQAGFVAERSEAVQARFQPPAAVTVPRIVETHMSRPRTHDDMQKAPPAISTGGAVFCLWLPLPFRGGGQGRGVLPYALGVAVAVGAEEFAFRIFAI